MGMVAVEEEEEEEEGEEEEPSIEVMVPWSVGCPPPVYMYTNTEHVNQYKFSSSWDKISVL